MRCLPVSFFLLASLLAHAQDSLLTPGRIIKVSPFHLVNFYPTVEVSYEQPVSRKMSLQAEGGYVLNYSSNQDSDYRNKRGMKAKLESRYYFWSSPRHIFFQYVSGEGYGNVIQFDRSQTRRECFDVDCTSQYTRQYDYTVRYREFGFSVKYGITWAVRRFVFDLNGGLTLRSIRYRIPEFTGQAFPDDDISFFEVPIPNETNRTTIGPNLGIRFGYRLR